MSNNSGEELKSKKSSNHSSTSMNTHRYNQQVEVRENLIKQLERVIFFSNGIIFTLLMVCIFGVCSFVVLLNSYSFSYEPGMWDRPAHWLLRLAEIFFVLTVIGFALYIRLVANDAIETGKLFNAGVEWKA